MAADVTIGGTGELFVGEDKILVLEVLDSAGDPVNMDGWQVKFFVRSKNNSPDPALLEKTALISGLFNATRASNAQRATVTLTDTEMNTLSAKSYRHSWKRMDDASETVLAYGDFIVQKATAP